MVSVIAPDPRAAFAAMTEALITDFRAYGGQVGERGFSPARLGPAIACTSVGTVTSA
jgi:hypothetical protein